MESKRNSIYDIYSCWQMRVMVVLSSAFDVDFTCGDEFLLKGNLTGFRVQSGFIIVWRVKVFLIHFLVYNKGNIPRYKLIV